MIKNTFWAVYDKKNKVISISINKETAQQEALKLNNYRWTEQTLKTDWGYLEKKGYTIKKSIIKPIHYYETKR